MRRWTRQSRVLTSALLVCLASILSAPVLRAQDGDAGPGGLPAGSQMVRGTVTAATADALTIKVESGDVYKITVTPNTRVMKARQPVKLAEIKAGDGVGAMGVMDVPAKTLHAVFVTVVDAEQIKKAQADLGKTYIAGEVTAIDADNLKLTIKRSDGVSQTIGVDEGTSFRRGGRGMRMMMGAGAPGADSAGGAGGAQAARTPRSDEGGESITLADVKVGDSVVGRGALKSGTFVPAELRVMDAAARRRRGGAGNGAPASGPAVAPPPASVP